MKLRYSDDGFVDGGVECSIYRNGEHETETVFDLTDWIKRQLLELQKEAEGKHQSGGKYLAFHHIWIGDGQMPFGAIQATKSKYIAYCVHPELRDTNEWSFESSDVDKVSFYVAAKAARVSDLDWQPSSNTN